MAWMDKALKRVGNMIMPQFFNDNLNDFEVQKGENGAAFYITRGTIAMESWEGSANITKTFTSNRYGFSIVNDGTANLTFTINTQTRTVKPGENYHALFEPFTSVVITATSAYRAEVLR
jgi:hypothetical protein